MARFFLTNSQNVFEKARSTNSKSGLVESGMFDAGKVRGIVYDKRQISADNFLELEEGDTLGVTGTLLYERKLGIDALAEVASEDDLLSRRSQFIGHYAVIRSNDGVVTVFTDPIASYEVFYYSDSEVAIVSNSLYVIASAVNGLSVDPKGLLER